MGYICTRCGGTNVACEAIVNPNTGKIIDYFDGSFMHAICSNCENEVIISNIEEVKHEIDLRFHEFVESTLSKEDVDKIHSYGIKLPTNRLGNEGYFNSTSLSDLENQIRKVLERCLSYKIVEEVPVIKYQLETLCLFAYDKNGDIVPNPSVE